MINTLHLVKKLIPHAIYSTGCTLLSISACFCQDIHFSQFFETPLLRNPALAGIFSGDLKIQGVYRSQWNSVTIPYQTASLNGEYKQPIGRGDDFLTLGGQILYDKAGTIALTATHILPVVNYHKSLSAEKNMYLSLGFMGGLVQRRLDRSKITTNSQFDGTDYNPVLSDGENFSNTGYSYLDGSVGLSFNSQIGESEDNNLFFGAAYHHFNNSAKVSFYGDNRVVLLPKVVLSAGVRMGISEYAFVTFQGDAARQGSSTETIGGMLYSYKLDDHTDPTYVIHAGAFIRWKDALIPVAKLECKPLAIAVSYDANVSRLKTASQGRGGFEISVSYQVYFDRENSTKNAVRCTRF